MKRPISTKNKQTAKALREVARSFELNGHDGGSSIYGPTDFTCGAVRRVLGYVGREAYSSIFFVDEHRNNEAELWNMTDRKTQDMRVLLLCFAAAMAETGNFKPIY